MSRILLTRDEFREAVFARDGHRCVVMHCHQPAQDVHHLYERRLWTDGGFYIDNGVSLCAPHHMAAEETRLSVDDLAADAGISHVPTPQLIEGGHRYDKWGNIILNNGQRMIGPLFYDSGVQNALHHLIADGTFTKYVKYPRTPHLPWSPGIGHDDIALSPPWDWDDMPVVVTEKMDGENTTIYDDYIHARSIDSGYHISRTWIKNFAAKWQHELNRNMRICGENLWAAHSIHYRNLEDYFLGYSVWDGQWCLNWNETVVWLKLVGVTPVRELYRGSWRDAQTWMKTWKPQEGVEGFVVRPVEEFPLNRFRENVFKYVRANHVTTTTHWRAQSIVRNELAK
jgi:hypothetical protein